VLSLLYLGLRRVFEFLILLGRSADRKELEILVRWTYERRVRGRPPLDAERVALIRASRASVDEIVLAVCSMNTSSQRDDWVYAPYGATVPW
jgi:hypothetical protein